jgi:hypothetical protein
MAHLFLELICLARNVRRTRRSIVEVQKVAESGGGHSQKRTFAAPFPDRTDRSDDAIKCSIVWSVKKSMPVLESCGSSQL